MPTYLRLSARSAGKQGECQFQWQAQIALSLIHHREHGVHRVKKGVFLSATISEICGKTGGKSISMASANCLILGSPQRTRSAQSEKKAHAYLRLSARSAGKQGESQFQWQAQIALSLVHHREHGVHRVKKRCLLICDYQRDLRENRGKANFNGKRKLPYP